MSTAVVAVISGIGSGVVVAVSNHLIVRRQGADARRAELKRDLAALLAMLGRVEHELRLQPRASRSTRLVNEQMEARFPQLDYVLGRVQRRLLFPHLDGLVAAMLDAAAAVVLIAPPELLPAIEPMSELMKAADAVDEDWWRRWDEARADLVVGCRAVLADPEGPKAWRPLLARVRTPGHRHIAGA